MTEALFYAGIAIAAVAFVALGYFITERFGEDDE